MYDILSVFVGKWFLGGIGWCVRNIYFYLVRLFGLREEKENLESDFSEVIDVEEYQNRIVGFKTVLIIIVIIQVFQAL